MKTEQKIGDWELVRQLNSGGMGQLWQARKVFATGDTRVVAIKLLKPEGVLNPRVRDALLTEAGIQMRLQHPNIPKVVDVGVHEGLPYLVMDYIAGRDLKQLLEKLREQEATLDAPLVAHIVREAAYALQYAHTFEVDRVPQNVVHRDVASKNIMVDGRGGVFVVDFGVAEAASHQTSRNYIKGTMLYMAPEHALGFPTAQSDAWGLGTVLWELLENRVFRADVSPDELRRVSLEGWVPPLTHPEQVHDVLRFLVEGLLRKDPHERLSLADVISHLEGSDFPPRRTALQAVMRRCFGASVMQSGQTLHDFVFSPELNQTMAAAQVAKDASPLAKEEEPWADKVFGKGGIPPLVPTSSTQPIAPRALQDEDSRELAAPDQGATRSDSAPLQPVAEASETQAATSAESQPSATVLLGRDPLGNERPAATTYLQPPFAEDYPAAPATTERIPPPMDSAPVARSHGRTTPAEFSPAAPPSASYDSEPVPQARPQAVAGPGLAPTSSPHVYGTEVAVATPVPPRSRARSGALIGLLGVVGLFLLAWVVSATRHDDPSDGESNIAARVEDPSEGTLPSLTIASDPGSVQAQSVKEPLAVSAAEQPPPSRPVEPLEPEPEPKPVVPDVGTSQAPSVAADAPADPVVPTTEQPTEPRPSKPKAKPRPAPRSQLFIAIGFVEVMAISIGGSERVLRMRGTDTAKIAVRPGRRTVRWGPPGKLTNSKRVLIEKGTDYKVMLGSKGPTFSPIPGGGQ